MSNVKKSRLQSMLKQAEKSRTNSRNVLKLHILFVTRPDVRTLRGFYVDMRMTYKGTRFQRATGIKIRSKSMLNAQAPAIIGNPEQTALLQDLKAQAQKLFLECKLTERPIDLELIWGCILGIDHFRDGTPSLLGLIAQFEKAQEQRKIAGDIAGAVFNKLSRWNVFLSEFVTDVLGKSAQIDDLKPRHAKELDIWLKKNKQASHNYTQYIITHLKRVLNYAVEFEYINRNPLINFRRSFTFKKGEYLTIQEVEAIQKITLFDPALQIVRDIAVFMAWTGLAYIDMNNLRPEHIKQTTDGDYFIEKSREKTGQPAIIYLTEKPLEILEKYREHPQCQKTGLLLPMLTNQGLNRILKELAPMAGIKKVITCHCLRRTYATILYAAGTDSKAIRAAMGHSNLSMTEKHYAHLQPDAIVRELKNRLAQ